MSKRFGTFDLVFWTTLGVLLCSQLGCRSQRLSEADYLALGVAEELPAHCGQLVTIRGRMVQPSSGHIIIVTVSHPYVGYVDFAGTQIVIYSSKSIPPIGEVELKGRLLRVKAGRDSSPEPKESATEPDETESATKVPASNSGLMGYQLIIDTWSPYISAKPEEAVPLKTGPDDGAGSMNLPEDKRLGPKSKIREGQSSKKTPEPKGLLGG